MKSYPNTHSATVDMRLQVNGTTFEVAQSGADFVILDAAGRQPLPPCYGELIVEIDGNIDCRRVRLPAGVQPEKSRTPIEAA